MIVFQIEENGAKKTKGVKLFEPHLEAAHFIEELCKKTVGGF
jgi:hypothetical protein